MRPVSSTLFLNVLLFIVASVFLSADASAYFQCTDSEGHVTFQSLPCPVATVEEQKRSVDDGAVIPPASISQRLRISHQPYVGIDASSIKSLAIMRSQFASALASLSPLRALITTFYAENGDWPKKLADIGLQSAQMHSNSIVEADVGQEGIVIARLTKDIGDQKIIVLQPELALGGTTVQWQCFANFPKDMLASIGSSICKSRKISY